MPRPCGLPLQNSPMYFLPSDVSKVPWPWNLPSLNAPTYRPPSAVISSPTQFVQVEVLLEPGQEGSWLWFLGGGVSVTNRSGSMTKAVSLDDCPMALFVTIVVTMTPSMSRHIAPPSIL